MLKIPSILFRGGTSKGPFFLKTDLPKDTYLRDKLLLRLMGSPHVRQIDGIGGGDSLSSKVGIVGLSERKNADIDYLLCQVHVNSPIVETTLNCGNMLSAVAPFAIETGLIVPTDPETTVRIYNENTNTIIISTLQTPQGIITYTGDTVIDGVPGTSAPIKLTFVNAVGSKTAVLLPTGNVVDEIEGVNISCVDVAVPMVIVPAKSLNKTGYETKAQLDADYQFLQQLQRIRQKAAIKMGMGDVSSSINPKICLVSRARNTGTITSRYFTPFLCHDAHAISGALCLAAACFIEGSVAHNVAKITLPSINNYEHEYEVIIEHPSGKINTFIKVDKTTKNLNFPFASFIRTARPLFQGNIIIPRRSDE